MQTLSHPNIVQYYGTGRDKDSLFIFMEYMPHGSISNILKKFGRMREDNIKLFTRQILLGLDYLHNNRVKHQDIKGANILLSDKVAKLADLGCSYQFEGDISINPKEISTIQGSIPWMAPEMIRQDNPGRKADIWSVGCTLVEMVTGKRPWADVAQISQLMFQIASGKKDPPIPKDILDNLSVDFINFMACCFKVPACERYTASQLLEHSFLRLGK